MTIRSCHPLCAIPPGHEGRSAKPTCPDVHVAPALPLETSSARRLHSHVPKSNLQTPAATRSLHETYTTNVLHVSLDVRAYEHAMGSREPLCVCDATAAWQRFDFRAEWPHGACQRMYSSNLPTRYEYGMNSHAGTCTGPEGEASGVPSRLGAVVTDLAAQWAACPDSDLEGNHDSTGESGSEQLANNEHSSPCLTMDEARQAMAQGGAVTDSTSHDLAHILDSNGLTDIAEHLREQTLRSLLVRLEERVELLAFLKASGVDALPKRQKLANALSKLKREQYSELEQPTAAPLIVSFDALDDDDGISNAFLFTPDGRQVILQSPRVQQHQPPSTHALDGPILTAVRRLARLAAVHVLVPLVPRCLIGSAAAAAASKSNAVVSAFAQKIAAELCVVRVVALLPYRLADAPHAPGSQLLQSLDELANQPVLDERPTTRRRLARRRQVAIWRGGRGGAAEAGEGSLRARLVHHCTGRSDYDVGFLGTAAPRSRRQMISCQVLLLVEGGSTGWDASWKWALSSGCVLVVLGSLLPPLPQLEPWAHFVPAAVDLSDLDVRVRWALEDPAAEAVAQRCRELYDELCAPGRAVRSLVGLFSELAAATSTPKLNVGP